MVDARAQAAAAAAGAGFDLFGVAPADADAGRERVAEWVAHGYHGAMRYMERRLAPGDLLEGCRSVIALGVNYWTGDRHRPGPKVSRYAWGEDYHRVVGRMLADLVDRLGAVLPGERFRGVCDTAPLAEKAWAEAAGLGWIGKNGCLISTRFGSWVFLAVVLTTAELPPDAPHPDRCGTCDRCLHSCPTDAFVAPRVLDARRCIPYLTIEQWQPIPRELPISPWAFGCDACQEVCPWNSMARACGRAGFAPRPGGANPDLRAWVTQTGPEYRARYGDTALARPGRRGLARNALAVLRDDPGGLDPGVRAAAAADRSALVRRQAESQ